MINIISSSRYKINRKKIRTEATAFLEKAGETSGYVLNIVFVGKNKMKAVSQKYKKESVALPVLSFKYDEINEKGETLLGEIILCFPQVVLLSAERNKRVDEMIKFLIEHGINNLIN